MIKREHTWIIISALVIREHTTAAIAVITLIWTILIITIRTSATTVTTMFRTIFPACTILMITGIGATSTIMVTAGIRASKPVGRLINRVIGRWITRTA